MFLDPTLNDLEALRIYWIGFNLEVIRWNSVILLEASSKYEDDVN